MNNLYLLGKKTSLSITDRSIHSGQEKNKTKQKILVCISIVPHRSRSALQENTLVPNRVLQGLGETAPGLCRSVCAEMTQQPAKEPQETFLSQ